MATSAACHKVSRPRLAALHPRSQVFGVNPPAGRSAGSADVDGPELSACDQLAYPPRRPRHEGRSVLNSEQAVFVSGQSQLGPEAKTWGVVTVSEAVVNVHIHQSTITWRMMVDACKTV